MPTMPSARRHPLVRRLAVTAVVAAGLGATGAGVAVAATSTSSPSSTRSPSATTSSASPKPGSSSGSRSDSTQGRAHHCTHMGGASGRPSSPGAPPSTG
jgi:hypothetical protein